MRVNSFTPNLIKPKSNCNFKGDLKGHFSEIAPRLSYTEIPSIAFRSLLKVVPVKETMFPDSLAAIADEMYKVKLFSKIENKLVDTFIHFGEPDPLYYGIKPPNDKTLRLYEPSGLQIGEVSINPSDWMTREESEFAGGLPRAYTRLHYLDSSGKQEYAGIGSVLIQASIEKSLQTDAKGRIYVSAKNFHRDAQNDPFSFYNKMGLSIVNPRGESNDLSEYIGAGAEMLNITRSNFRALTLKTMGIDYSDYYTSPDKKMSAIYETVANHKQCRLDEIYLNFQEWMYLHDDAVQKIWLPKIEANPIFSESNRIK